MSARDDAAEVLTLDPHGAYIGRSSVYGDVALYNDTGAELVVQEMLCGDGPALRRALRTVRRVYGGPMRLRCVVVEGSGDRETRDGCDVYGWRAALTALRAMRSECRRERYVHLWVGDARLHDLMEGGGPGLGDYRYDHPDGVPTRILRARLALYLRAVLRAEAADAWEASDWTGTPPPMWGLVCDQCGERGFSRHEEPGLCRSSKTAAYVQASWRHPRPLWLSAPPHGGK